MRRGLAVRSAPGETAADAGIPTQPRHFETVIIGTGLSWLLAATRLQKRRCNDFVLLERNAEPRLAALLPGPRSHLTRYHGVFAPHARWRSAIVPGRPSPPTADRTPAERQRAMTWAQRLARVFRIDVTRCDRCGGLRGSSRS
jgi:cation diffusion facilitator CzcD-associated flavoprotein CzcO